MTALAYVLLGMGMGLLFGLAATYERIPEPPIRPAVVERVMAQEVSKPENKTCYYTQSRQETYTIALPDGVECITVLGETK